MKKYKGNRISKFDIFYRDHPNKKKIDDAIRKLPELGEPGAKGFHPLNSLFQLSNFDVNSKITRDIVWKELPDRSLISASPEEFTVRAKGYARYLGADLVGIARLNQAYVYSHIGRSPGTWGAPIKLDHSFAIVIGVEMSYEMLKHAPGVAVTTESSFKYFEAAKVALLLARYIHYLGYEARAHVDGNYRVLCVPLAIDAGLGELGRLGLLITPQFGPRLRLSVVTTNLPLIMSIACSRMAMTPLNAWVAVTVNAAYSLGRAGEIGAIAPGHRADLVVWDADDYRQVAYFYGENLVRKVVKNGEVVYSR